MDEAFTAEMASGYAFDEPCVILGRPMKDGEVETGATVRLPLAMMNRHGLVAGATGTGKTKTLQIMAGQLSAAGVPVFISDIKGDVTGVSRPGDATAAAIRDHRRSSASRSSRRRIRSSCCRSRAPSARRCVPRCRRSARCSSARCST